MLLIIFLFIPAVSSVLQVFKEDPKHPRLIKAQLDGKSGIKDGFMEFDTIESAREWRRELQGKSESAPRAYIHASDGADRI